MHYQEQLDNIFGKGSLWKHRTLRTIFDPFSSEYDNTTMDTKLEILKTIKDNNIDFSILIQGYKDFYLEENKPNVIKSLEGGVIGVWTHIADTPTDYATNIRAMVDVVGIDHVCIGTDTKMATSKNANEKFGKQTNQSWENSKQVFFYTVVDAMLKSGFTEKEIIKIGGGNYCRIFDQATTV